MMKCPNCETVLEHREQGKTHIYVCPECPFIGFEYLNKDNIFDLYENLEGQTHKNN